MANPPPPLVPERASPSMLAYSLLFAFAYFVPVFVIGTLVQTYAPNVSMGNVGHVLVVLAALLTGWLFVKRQKRLFTPAENTRIITFCILWVFLLDALAMVGMADKLASLPESWLVGVLGFGFAFDALLVWLVYKRAVKKMMLKHVAPDSGPAV